MSYFGGDLNIRIKIHEHVDFFFYQWIGNNCLVPYKKVKNKYKYIFTEKISWTPLIVKIIIFQSLLTLPLLHNFHCAFRRSQYICDFEWSADFSFERISVNGFVVSFDLE